jgi:hypothetical protein
MTAYSKCVYNTLDKISSLNISKNVYNFIIIMLQRMYAFFAKYIGLAV